jgi:hypothetical protein
MTATLGEVPARGPYWRLRLGVSWSGWPGSRGLSLTGPDGLLSS